MTPSTNIPLAIIGLGCRLPGADSPARFMNQSLEGMRALTAAPGDWNAGLGVRHALLGGFVPEEGKDWKLFRLPPTHVEKMHRMERLLHLTLVQATQDAGYGPDKSPGARCAIYLGSTGLGVDVKIDQALRLRTPEFSEHLATLFQGRPDGARLLEAVARYVDQHAPPIVTETVPMTATMVANRLSSLLDTRGGHFAVDAGTGSSMAALRMASLSLQLGQCDVAVVGAVSPLLSPSAFGLLSARGWLASEELYALDGRAAGTLPGEGAVALVLCRLDDALADKQRIYAVLHGVGSDMNPRTGLSRMSRLVDRAARACMELGGVEPDQVRHLELQACGVRGLEDQELLGLKAAFCATRSEPLTVSTAAPQVGFQQGASGLVSVMRAALSLHAGVCAPVVGLTAPRHAEDGKLQFLTRPEKLPARACVGVSSLGWNNMAWHALLGPAPTREAWSEIRPMRPPTQKFAIVGMGALAPGAPDAPALWNNTLSKADAIGDLPASRFDVTRTLGALLKNQDVVPRLAGTVEIPPTDTRWLKLPPAQAAALDPAVPLFVKAAEEALTQAGHEPGHWDGRRVQVVVGQLPVRAKEFEVEVRFVLERYLKLATEALRAQGLEDTNSAPLLDAVRQRVLATVPPLDENATQYYSGLACASRLAALHDFSGGVMATDAACASSPAAVHAGMLALANRDVDVVVAGGVAFNLVPEYAAALAVLGILSPRGTFPFDDRADGFVPAEGAGAVVIKRLEDAEARKDRIIAVISGIGFSSDGRGTTLFTPNPRGQARAVERALEDAKVHPDQVGLLEAHGTGTRMGDATEAAAYGEAFQSRGRDNPVPMGTLKSQIGHTSSASGILALIKTAYAVSEAILPPMNGGEFPKAEIPFDKLPIALSMESRPWPTPRGGRRYAGVSSFGIGGTNYHLLLEDHDNSHRRTQPEPTDAPATTRYPMPSRGLTAQRWRVDLVPLSLSAEKRYRLAGKKLLLVGDEPGLVAAFSRLLLGKGVSVSAVPLTGIVDPLEVERRVRQASDELGGVDGVIDLGAFGPAEYFLTLGSSRFARRMAETTARWHGTGRALYSRFSEQTDRSACYVAVTSMGGDFGFLGDGGNVMGGSLAGFLKGLKQELPELVAKTIDFEPRASHWVVAETVARELEEGSDRTEVGYMAGRRFVSGLRRADFPPEDQQEPRQLDPSWVLLFTGGGRGAVFEVAKSVARLGPKVIVTGRTPAPTGDEPYLSMDDEEFDTFRKEELRRRKKADPALTMVRFNESFEACVRARELWRNLQEVYAQGLPIEYELCDVRNAADVRAMVDRVREYHGHIDGVVHGAMVEASKSLPDKTPGIVAATVEVKVLGLINILEATRRDDLKLMMCFGSGAGRFGNKGQADYSAANDLMSKCAMAYAHRARPHTRCVTIDWTAWESVGAAARNREVVQGTGVSFISPAEGSYWFINELLLGHTEREVAIFEERLFREWPFLGASADGPDARTVYDDRGLLLVPSDYPMLDCVQEHDRKGLIATRTFDLSTDPFVLQHQLDSIPIMPGTFGFEMLAEVAALFRPDLEVLRAENLRIETPLKFFKGPSTVGPRARGKPVHVTLTAQVIRQEGDEVTLYVESSSDLALGGRSEQTQRRIHQQGMFVLGPPRPLELSEGKLPEALPGSRARSIFHLAKEPLYLGPLFCRAEWVYVGDTEVEGIIRAPRQRDIFTHVSGPHFQLDPLLLDAAFQVAANWDGHHNNLVSVPMGVDYLERGRPRSLGEAGHVRARMVRAEGDDVLYDFEVHGEDGALLLGGTGLWFRRLRRGDRRFVEG
ncbi:SDR family NAD(P)-dependent oxidoreductase [Archangium primigenium]|uniref:SDR family NAD(P)-dependent oxidoreductase n=1 Tax=[Archangium] primigenium TaxID=2792470 RepID=UPI00195768DA|nr:SDR family NAD(P)-dependent oxidoreductase [Archangium primigenium]MBM7118797.1 SDR family NAD(P)-dependent oxidoreductase [Archangium primigenium]